MRLIMAMWVVVLLVPATVFAQKTDNTVDLPQVRVNCNVEFYDAYAGTGGEIPDDDPGGVIFGPLQTPPGDAIEDVILFVNMEHTWIGDLRLWLLYDHTCDGTGDIIGQVLCRPGAGVEGCPVDGCCGCSGSFNNWYAFDDGVPSIEAICPSEYISGCYGPDFDSIGLSVFNCASSGGCFWLFVADGASADTGIVHDWIVNVLYESTPVDEGSWATVKALYR